MEQKLSTLEKIGGWFSTLLLGNTKELIIRIDERLRHVERNVDELRIDMKEVRKEVAMHGADIHEMRKEIIIHGADIREMRKEITIHGADIHALKTQLKFQ